MAAAPPTAAVVDMPHREFRTRPYGAEFCELVHHEHAQRSVADVRGRRAYNWAAAAVAGVIAGEACLEGRMRDLLVPCVLYPCHLLGLNTVG